MSMIEVYGNPRAFESLTVGTATPVSLTNSNIYPTGQAPSNGALVSLASGTAYYRVDGGIPDATHRHVISQNDTLALFGVGLLVNFKILSASGEVTVCVTYLRD